jgi:large subunit ribosomal protein L15
MKLHQLKPAPGSRRARTRVGRGIAAGKGKTAGRGTKGQKARAGASIPAWFEGGQTPIHVRVPKLRGFRSMFKIDYQVVNVGRIAEYAAAGRFGVELAAEGGAGRAKKSSADAPVSVNPENLAAAGLVGSSAKPVKVLGHGDVSAKLFVVADAFTASAREKIEAAGGFVQLLNPVPEKADEPAAPAQAPDAEPEAAVAARAEPVAESEAAPAEEPEIAAGNAEETAEEAKPARRARATKDAESE